MAEKRNASAQSVNDDTFDGDSVSGRASGMGPTVLGGYDRTHDAGPPGWVSSLFLGPRSDRSRSLWDHLGPGAQLSSTFDTEPSAEPTMEPAAEALTGPAAEPVDPATEPAAGPVDGRTARAVRTRRAIVDACIALLAEGDLRPSAPRIAERASVSVRSVFQHFDDLETLYAAVGERVGEQVLSLIGYIDPARPLEERLVEFFHQRASVNEALTPTLRAAVVHAHGSPTINKQFQSGHGLIGAHVAEVFGPEIEQAGDRREVVYGSLVVASSWTTWNTLRALDHRSEVEAEQVLVNTAASVLGTVVGRDLTHLVDTVAGASTGRSSR